MNKTRLNIIILLILLVGAAVIGRLFSLQVLDRNFYKALAQGQHKLFSDVSGERGEIFFSGGEKLATNQTTSFVYISPREVKDREKVKIVLSQIFDLKQDFLEEKLNKDSLYELIKDKITDPQIEKLERLKLEGIYIGEKRVRSYPQAGLASQTIGFIDSENQGQYGLEAFWQETLEGKGGTLEEERGASGLLISFSLPQEIKKGSDLILTLDYQVQFEAERILNKAKEDLKIDSGTIIVIKPDSGEIIALANYPNFDPNNYEQEKMASFQNSAIQKIFEPGSVFKPFTMASAIQEQKITPQTTYVDEGVVYIGKIPIYNYANRSYGQKTMTEVLEKSINTGAVWAYQQLGSELFLKYLNKFGFFEKTNIDLQAEVFSQNQEFKKGYEINFATASFGQGIEITPIQLVRAYCAIANGGRLVKPYLVKKIINEDGSVKETLPEVSRNIISQETSSKVALMMTNVIENGFSKKAKIPGYFIAGKTGTAQVSWGALDIDKSGYSDKTIQSFIGFAPSFNPQFLILVKLDNPEAKTAEYSALPVFRDLAKYIIDLWQIPPDYEVE